MSFEIKCGTVNKKSNSTYTPTTELSTTYAVTLKEGCSDHNPSFLLQNSNNTFPHNYLQWGNWYYFIDDVIREHNQLIRLNCHMDELATYKAYILASSAFVAYDTTPNTELVDTRLSLNTTKSLSINYANSSFFETACVLVGIVGRTNAGIYALSISTASRLLNSINSWLNDDDMLPIPDIDLSTIDDVAGALAHNITVGFRQLIATGKAPDCIKSAILVPVGVDDFTGTTETIYLGNYDTNLSGKRLTSAAVASETTTVSIPWQFSDWRRNNPYTQVYLSLPYVGCINIPSCELIGESSIQIETHVSSNGSVSYNVGIGSDYTRIMRFGGNCSSNYMIGASNINPLNSALSGGTIAGAGIAAAFASGGTALAAAGAAGIAGFLNGVTSLPTSVGGSGGGAFSDSAIIACFTICHNTNVEPSSVGSVIGTPTMAVKSLGTLTGYVETKCASVSAPASRSVIDSINNQLDGGVYIE